MGYKNPFDRKAIGLDEDPFDVDVNADSSSPSNPPAPALASTAAVTPPPSSVSPPVMATPPPTPAVNTAWNTDGFATPGYTTAGQHSQAKTAGWDAVKFADANHQTPKYVVGRILSNYADNPAGLTSAMGDIAKAYPGASLVDGGKSGKINIPGVGVIDVGVSFGAGGGQGWAWQGADTAAANPTAQTGVGNDAFSQMLARVFGYHGTTPAAAPPASWGAVTAPASTASSSSTTGTQTTQGGGYASGPVMPTGRPAADGSTTWSVGAPVPSMPGSVYNAAGGFESASTFNAQPTSTAASQPTASTPINGGYGNITLGQYDDPATNDLLNFVSQRISDLTQQGSQTPQSVQQLIAALQGAAVNTANSPETARLQDLLTQAIGRANAPAYDDHQKSVIRADALAQLQDAHDRALVQARETLAARNIPLDSGVALEMQQHISDQYARNKTMIERGLSIDEINKLDENRALALNAAGESANVASGQQGKVLELMKLATDVESGDVTTRNNAMNQVLQLFSLPVSIADQRFNDAAALANGASANPGNLMTQLAQIAQGNQSIQNQNQQNSAAMWTNIAKAVASIDWTGKK